MQLFTSRVRPILEYGNVIWNPRLIRDIDAVERVQRRATKTVPGISTMSYSDRLRTLRLPSLVYRRARGDMIETYKFLHNVYDLNNEWLRRDPSTRTRGHSLKLEKRRCQTTMRQHCFSNRVINNWNSLPESIISAPTVNSFKSKLDQHWYNHIYSTRYCTHSVNETHVCIIVFVAVLYWRVFSLSTNLRHEYRSTYRPNRPPKLKQITIMAHD